MLAPDHRRIIFAREGGQPLPLTLESMGYNPDQETVSRPDGYHIYHWLQTADGEGLLELGNAVLALPEGTGVLLLPGTPHRYKAVSARKWGTYYLTFGGGAAESIAETLGMQSSGLYRWEQEAPLSRMIREMLDSHDAAGDIFSLTASTSAYRFLLTLSTFGQTRNSASLSRNADKLQPLLKWMDSHFEYPDIGLHDLSDQLGVSGRYLGSLFMQTFGLSPYAYLVRLRIRKSKELLISRRDLTVKAISGLVGFRDVSHFVATFRKLSNITPEQFRRLH
ncbi:AraC family transcriptional regulator [Paenibacillus tepidiphilus]|uniref:AraC family transcriptional regulator n=1 Tax=Paenibacillus tepidiphilus TaxID=2608683 RepID=UPI00123AF2DF|nr:AraC family transcriptional regulator [Paenibacillus tepidiphilus]